LRQQYEELQAFNGQASNELEENVDRNVVSGNEKREEIRIYWFHGRG